jgi:Protein of unknown function (DUF3048) N-terminal domain/Protein of unknown function (DUF3048) C-terminal domain
MRNKKVWGAVVVCIVVTIVFSGCKKKDEKIEVNNNQKVEEGDYIPYSSPANASPITGLACENNDKRSFAIMYSGDKSARQYFANLSLADFVLEMPHRPMHGQPRLMGVFQCNTPGIVGPMRSGRTDHISVAGSLDAVYVPWGGSSVGKNLLKNGVIDHIDCNGEVAPSGGAACFRRSGSMSHLEAASSSVPELIKVAESADYRKESQFEGFSHQGDISRDQRPDHCRVSVKFEKPNRAMYEYDPETNSYLRFLDGEKDIDFETKKQYAPKNLITIVTKKDAWLAETDYKSLGLKDPWEGIDETHRVNDNGQYPNMQLGDPWFDTKYEGEAEFYFNGQQIVGKWKRKKGLENPFEFYDEKGKEIHFVPGQIWMHVLGHGRSVGYDDEEEYAEKMEEG